MLKKKTLTLENLRGGVAATQRAIFDDIWAHLKAHHVGLPERSLLDKYGKETLLRETKKLGGTVVYSNHEENKLRYNLGVIGIFLTSEGPHLENVLERYLVALRDEYLRNKEIETFSSKDLASWAADLTPSDIASLRHILYRTHGSLASRVGGWNSEEWFISVDNDVVELKDVHSWREYIQPRILKGYDPRQPADERERMSYHASGTKPNPLWTQIYQRGLVRPSASLKRTTKNISPSKLDLGFIRNDRALLRILRNDWKEACQHVKTKAWKSCVLLCAGIVEGLLLWQLEDSQRSMSTSEGTAVDVRYDGEVLSVVIRISKEQGLIGEAELFLTEWARIYRNTIHPGNQRRKGRTPTKKDAALALNIVQVVAQGVRSKSLARFSPKQPKRS